MKRKLTLISFAVFVLVGLYAGTPQGLSQVSGFLPDLVPVSIDLDPENPAPNQFVTITATIRNEGTAEAERFFANIRADGTIIHSPLIPDGLGPGEQIEISTQWPLNPETRQLSAEVDTNFRVDELDESNNLFTRSITLAPDLVIENVQFIPEFPRPNETTTILITVSNQSEVDITETIGLRVSRDRVANFDTQFLRDGLAGGESQTIEIQRTIDLGEHFFRIVVDHTNSLVELDELNNSFEQLVNVSPLEPTGADMVIRDVLLIPSNFEAGDLVTVQAIIENVGSGIATGFDVALQIDGTEQGRASTQSLLPGATAPVTFLWPADDEERNLRIKVDPEGLIPEQNESNNASSVIVDPRAPLPFGCGQYVWINVNDEALEILSALTGLDRESVQNVFLPRMRDVMTDQYTGINVRVTFDLSRIPAQRGRATVSFTGDDRGNTLGLAPLGQINGTGFVFMGSFNQNLIQSLTFLRQVIVIGTVASHELGHLLGIGHTSENEQSDIMSASAEVSFGTGTIPPQFTIEARTQLQRSFPLSCL